MLFGASVDICAHHHSGGWADGDWAASNKAICDWLHRGRPLARVAEVYREQLEDGPPLTGVTITIEETQDAA